jgi:cardiolipin synthase
MLSPVEPAAVEAKPVLGASKPTLEAPPLPRTTPRVKAAVRLPGVEAGFAKKPSLMGRLATWAGAAMLLVGNVLGKPPLQAIPEPDPCVQVDEPGVSQCTTNNHLEILPSGVAYRDRLIAEIDTAQKSVWLNVFQIQGDPVAKSVTDALIRAHARGLDVRVVVDNRESSGDFKETHTNDNVASLSAAGIPVMRPSYDGFKVNHRKVVIIDGTSGFATGANVGGSYMLPIDNGWSYNDAAIFMRGPGVQDMARVFIQSYVDAGGEALRLPPRPAAEPTAATANAQVQTVWHTAGADRFIEREYVQRIDAARERVVLVNGFSMTDSIVDALIRAHDRGVSVQWIWGRASADTQAMAGAGMQRLLDAGVPIMRYAGPLHMKLGVFDSHVILGSANLDGFSMWRNDEMVLQIGSAQFAQEIQAALVAPALARSTALTSVPTDGSGQTGARAFVARNVITPLVNR